MNLGCIRLDWSHYIHVRRPRLWIGSRLTSLTIPKLCHHYPFLVLSIPVGVPSFFHPYHSIIPPSFCSQRSALFYRIFIDCLLAIASLQYLTAFYSSPCEDLIESQTSDRAAQSRSRSNSRRTEERVRGETTYNFDRVQQFVTETRVTEMDSVYIRV